MISKKLARFCRRLAFVQRWAVVPTVNKQSVAEHSYHVSVLTMWLMGMHKNRDDVEFKLKAAAYALVHDAKEARTGDTPAPIAGHEEPHTQWQIVVKVADKLESLLFILDETRVGNFFGLQVCWETELAALEKYWNKFEWMVSVGPVPMTKPTASELAELAKSIHYDEDTCHPILESDISSEDIDVY